MTNREKILRGVSDALQLFALSLSAGVCSGFGFAGGAVCAAACALFGVVFARGFLPLWWTVLPVFAAAFRFGAPAGGAAVLLAGVFVWLLSLLPERLRGRLIALPVHAGLIPAAAFLTTALQTENYFGIGASGADLFEIVSDYISHGFHPNWRGVLYGTIALVILITYPRKFKEFSRRVSAPFAAFAVTFVLHLLLVRDAVHSPVNEIGAIARRALLSGSVFGGVQGSVWQILLAALTLALLLTAHTTAAQSRPLSPVLLCTGALGGVPCTADSGTRSRLSAAVCCAVTAALYLCPLLPRMPVHTLGVILIVTAWQSVDHAMIRQACTSGARGIALFACGLVLPLVLGIGYAVPILCVLSLAFGAKQKD